MQLVPSFLNSRTMTNYHVDKIRIYDLICLKTLWIVYM